MMKKLHMLAATTVTGVALAATAISPVYAWHPKGQIIKSVQNVTQNTAYSDANTAAQAVSAKPGDILNYEITIKNIGDAANNNSNDMAFTVMTDTLPAGVELVGNANQRSIREDIGTVKPGASFKKQYQVKVTSETDGALITNQACFTGDSTVKDNAQKGCDNAVIKVTVPETPVTPVAPVTPEAPKEEAPVAELPNTGAGDFIIPTALFATLAGYAGYVLRLKRVHA